jgi:2,5-dichloro-2,5-cyclohexadiene-1,4-diol dehydrogenase 1
MLAGKVVIVTGAAAGIGRTAAARMAAVGAKVVLADINAEAGADNAREIRDAGGEALFVPTDIASEDAVRAMVDAATDRFGRLDGAFNNGAVASRGGRIHEMTLEAWQRTLSVNLTGTFLCMKYEIAAMLESGGGAIVNTSSTAGLCAFPMIPDYCAAKHGVIGLTRNAARDYGERKIRVNALAPGSVRTPMLQSAVLDSDPAAEARIVAGNPLGRISEPFEQADAAIWLLSDTASYVTGAVIPVDGGYSAN